MVHSHVAGGVVLNTQGDVLVTNQGGRSWSLPKGHIDDGESAREAAAREIWEETGVRELVFVRDLGSYDRYRTALDGGDDLGELKTIQFFLYTTSQMDLAPIDSDMHPEARWVAPEAVSALLTHRKDKAFFAAVDLTVANG